MANEFKIRKGLIVEGATGGTVVDVQGSLGQLFSVTDNLTGEIFAVADISGVPIMSINSSGSIKFGSYGATNQTGTPTYILGTTATGDVVKVLGTDVPGSVSGSGTLRTIPMWTPDGDTLGNSVLKQDVANQNIGLGVTPETDMVTYVAQLRIGEQSALQGHTDGVGADSFTCVTTNWKFATGGSEFINGTVAAPGFAHKYQQQTGDHSFSCSTVAGVAGATITERPQMVIKQSGNVGIGITSPTKQLHLLRTTGDVRGIMVETTVAASYAELQVKAASEFRIGTGGSSTTPNGQFYVYDATAGAHRFDIDANGNVGINNIDPVKKLDVVSTTSDVAGEMRLAGILASDDLPFGKINFANTATANTQTDDILAYIAGEKVGSSNRGELTFATSDAASPTEKMRIDSIGNVGIGTIDPGAQLHNYSTSVSDVWISGYGTAAQNDWGAGHAIFVAQDNGLLISKANALNNTNRLFSLYHDAGGNAEFYMYDTTSTNKVYLNSSGDSFLNGGNVGINDTSPDFKLDVGGTLGVSDLPFNTTSVSVLVANETIGAELVTNGDFATDTDWAKNNANWTISGGSANFTGSATAVLYQAITLTNAVTYKVRFSVSGSSGSGAYIWIGNSQGSINYLGGSYKYYGNGDHIEIFTMPSAQTVLGFYSNASSSGYSLDNVSLKQLTSASDQIQKREISADAFLPANGPYLPLTAGSGFPLTGDLFFDGSGNKLISSNTADGSDNAQIILQGGGGNGDTRGASVHVSGNESGNGGLLQLRAGDGSVGGIRFYEGGSERMRIAAGKTIIRTSTSIGITTAPGSTLQVGGLDDGNDYDITLGWNAVDSQAVGTKRSAFTFKTAQTSVNDGDIYKWDIAMIAAPATVTDEEFGSDLAFLRSTRDSTDVDTVTMVLSRTGNVGIGTNVNGPTTTLHVVGITQINTGSDTAFYEGASVRMFGSQSYSFRNSPGNVRASINVEAAGTNAGNLALFNASNVQTSYINNAGDSYFNGGNVGIGITGPNFKLDVVGTLGVSDLPFNSTSTSVLVANETLGSEILTNGEFNSATGWNAGSGWTISGGKASVDAPSTVALTQSISVTTNSVYKVSVEVSNYTSGSLQPQFGGSQVIASISANGEYNYTVTSTVTNTVFYLYAVGDAEFSVDIASIKLITSSSDQIQKRELGSSAFADTEYWKADGNDIYNTNSGEVEIIGDFTAGGAQPNATLQFNSNSANPELILKNNTATSNTAGTSTLQFKQALNSTGGKIVSTRDSNYADGASRNSNLEFYTSTAATDTLKMIIDSDGNVGIGITTPYTKLVVGSRGSAAATSILAYDGIAFDFYNDGNPYKRHGVIISQAADASESVLDFNTKAASGTNSTKMTILGNGNVGIGTTTPLAKLDIQGTQGQLFSVTDDLSGEIFAVADISGVPIMSINSNGISTFAGDIKLGPSSSIVIDDQPAASTASGSGTIVNWTVSTAVTVGQVYCLKSDGGWTNVTSNGSQSTVMLAYSLGTNANQGMLLQGFLYKSGHGFTIGDPLYISGTQGVLTNTAPTTTGHFVRIVGYATSTDYIYFDPDKTWVELT